MVFTPSKKHVRALLPLSLCMVVVTLVFSDRITAFIYCLSGNCFPSCNAQFGEVCGDIQNNKECRTFTFDTTIRCPWNGVCANEAGDPCQVTVNPDNSVTGNCTCTCPAGSWVDPANGTCTSCEPEYQSEAGVCCRPPFVWGATPDDPDGPICCCPAGASCALPGVPICLEPPPPLSSMSSTATIGGGNGGSTSGDDGGDMGDNGIVSASSSQISSNASSSASAVSSTLSSVISSIFSSSSDQSSSNISSVSSVSSSSSFSYSSTSSSSFSPNSSVNSTTSASSTSTGSSSSSFSFSSTSSFSFSPNSSVSSTTSASSDSSFSFSPNSSFSFSPNSSFSFSPTSSVNSTSFTSANSSFSFTLNSSSRSFVVNVCSGAECAIFGDAFCSLQNRDCATITQSPCFTCIERASSSFSFSQGFSSAGDIGGTSGETDGTAGDFGGNSSFSFSQGFSSSIGIPCTSDDACPLNTVCINNTCIPGCNDTSDCSIGVCQQGSCNPCTSNAECLAGDVCSNGSCTPPSSSAAPIVIAARGCTVDTQCAVGSCVNGSCVPCVTDGECNFGRCIQNSCQIPTLTAATALCGNGILENPEECDDSNTRDHDGCNSTCLLEIGVCGDGKIQKLLGEQCESSLHNPTLPYSCKNCRFSSDLCGDGNVDPGEECDEGQRNSLVPDATCRPDCSRSRCGDGILDSAELCDDGNARSGDGCDRFCKTEIPNTLVASQNITFPSQNTTQPLPFQLPLANLQPLIQSQGPVGDTGPAAVAVLGAGAASGIAWVRRKRRK